jgi:hypothetical protein
MVSVVFASARTPWAILPSTSSHSKAVTGPEPNMSDSASAVSYLRASFLVAYAIGDPLLFVGGPPSLASVYEEALDSLESFTGSISERQRNWMNRELVGERIFGTVDRTKTDAKKEDELSAILQRIHEDQRDAVERLVRGNWTWNERDKERKGTTQEPL